MKSVVSFTLLFIFSLSFHGAFASQYTLKTLTQQSDVIWGFDFLDENKIIFTERDGALKVLHLKDSKVISIQGVPEVHARNQGGLLDVRVDPENKNRIFITYSKKMPGGKNTTALGVAELNNNKLKNFKTLFSAEPANNNNIHYGSRIEFDKKGHIFFAVGDRRERDQAQDLSKHMGSVIRLKKDGSVPKDNPFVGQKNKKPEIWSYGHRSPQGLQFRPGTNELWGAEMGPRGGDEINLIEKAKNYGWPKATYGREYWGPSIGEEKVKGTVLPVTYWKPSISPSAIHFYKGDKYPEWNGQMLMATLSGQHLRIIKLSGQKVVGDKDDQIVLFKKLGLRFRNLRSGPDGYLYVSTDDGKIARVEKSATKSQ